MRKKCAGYYPEGDFYEQSCNGKSGSAANGSQEGRACEGGEKAVHNNYQQHR
jgi:hypothetical protein